MTTYARQIPEIKNMYFNNCEVINKIVNLKDLLETPLQMATEKEKKKLIIDAVLMPSSAGMAKEHFVLTPFDLAVMDAIFTLAMHKCWAFTPEMLMRVLKGSVRKRITKLEKTATMQSIEKLRWVNLNIDCTKEWYARQKTYYDKKEYRGKLLPVTEIENGDEHTQKQQVWYKLDLNNWSLYNYARDLHQVIKVPISICQFPQGNLTLEHITMRNYLCKRIEMMRNENNAIKNDVIRYYYQPNPKEEKGMFPALGYDLEKRNSYQNWRKEKSKRHIRICEMLDQFQSQNWIEGYEIRRHPDNKNGEILGVKIKLPEKKNRGQDDAKVGSATSKKRERIM